ncbi:MAG: molybdenum cofactor biosynthesis protein MoaE [Campylobacter sp.]|nr:molybdenum cofactor biosynthesis protein MoaE [Campylobacter sp.]
MELYSGALSVGEIYQRWYEKYALKNLGAFICFNGIVRAENGIEALSFDIYEPILKSWFEKWQEKLAQFSGVALFAHSIGDVKIHQTSYMSAILTPQRKDALRLIGEFVEDFKSNAPIWKYDVIDGKRIYAKDRSKSLFGAGLLA